MTTVLETDEQVDGFIDFKLVVRTSADGLFLGYDYYYMEVYQSTTTYSYDEDGLATGYRSEVHTDDEIFLEYEVQYFYDDSGRMAEKHINYETDSSDPEVISTWTWGCDDFPLPNFKAPG